MKKTMKQLNDKLAKKNQSSEKSEYVKGITLVALVITIVVLIIV